MKRKSTLHICINDLILAAALALAAVILLLVFTFIKGGAEGEEVVITVEGKVYGTYLLSQDREISIDLENGHNLVIIKDGLVHMEDADCPDKYCVTKGNISGKGETIVCLPHRLVVEICTNGGEDDSEKNDTDGFDVIAE